MLVMLFACEGDAKEQAETSNQTVEVTEANLTVTTEEAKPVEDQSSTITETSNSAQNSTAEKVEAKSASESE